MNNKVLFVISALGGGGAERVMTNVANEMFRRGITVEILKTGSRSNGRYNLNESIKVIQVPKQSCNKIIKAFRMVSYMRKVFKEHQGYTIISFLSDNNMLTIIATRGLKNRVVVCERNDPSQNSGNAMLRGIRNKLYLFADWNVFQTPDAKNYFSKSIREKGTIIPNPVVVREIIEQRNSLEKYIIAAGRFTPQKNYPMLIDAFCIFAKKHQDYKLKIYGDGPEKDKIVNMISEKGLLKKVEIHPFSENIHQLMANSCIYVSSSLYEGISNTMLEAMALGVPTLVTDCPVGGARMVIEQGVNGVYVPINDIDKMAEAMSHIVDDKNFNDCLRMNSKKIKDLYSLSNITDLWIQVL